MTTIASAVAAMDTACGSCAWITSGPNCLSTRASRHAAARSTSLRGASGTRSSPSDIRLKSSPSGCATSTARSPRCAQPEDGVLHLPLAPAPAARSVDVEGEHEEIQNSEFRIRNFSQELQLRSFFVQLCFVHCAL